MNEAKRAEIQKWLIKAVQENNLPKTASFLSKKHQV